MYSGEGGVVDLEIEDKPGVKYLASKMSLGDHIQRTSDKTASEVDSLARSWDLGSCPPQNFYRNWVQVQRADTYHPVSERANLVIAGVIAVNLLARSGRRFTAGKSRRLE